MPGARLPMRKLRDVLRLHASGLPSRQIGASLGIGQSTVVDYLARARRVGIGWPLPDELTDEALEARLFPPPLAIPGDQRPKPDWAAVHRELKRPGVTLQLIWEEHRAVHPGSYGYSRFCDLYQDWRKRLSPTSCRRRALPRCRRRALPRCRRRALPRCGRRTRPASGCPSTTLAPRSTSSTA